MECVPAVNVVVLMDVRPSKPARFGVGNGAEPKTTPLSKNLTMPSGSVALGTLGFTVAVNSTTCPTTDGLLLDVSRVVVSSLITTWVITVEEIPKLSSPLYVTLIEWLPEIGRAHV